MKGIDVSKYQGKIDWNKVKQDGVEFCVIRAGLGRYVSQEDTYFKTNMNGALSVGLPVGVYWYSYATSVAEAITEAQVCAQVINSYKDSITLPVFFDQEYEKGILALSNAVRTDICLAFMSEIAKYGYRAGLYCSYDWYKNRVIQSELTSYPVWIAQYANKCSYSGDNLVAWQYSSKGSVSGIAGNVDMSVGYDGLINTITTPKKNGWANENGTWYWYENGVMVKSKWIRYSGRWYYLGADGKMLTGMQQIDGEVYYLNEKNQFNIPEGACIITDNNGAIK